MSDIIDMMNSSSSPPRSSNASIFLNSIRQVQFENAPLPLISSINPNLSQANQQQIATPWPNFGHSDEPSQIVTRFQPDMQDEIVRLHEPNMYLAPDRAILNELWTQREHELFVMGLIRYGNRRWTRIANEFLPNKTPQQVQSYAANFLRDIPPPSSPHGFRGRISITSSPNPVSIDWNLVVDPFAPNSMPMLVNNQSQQLFSLVPMNAFLMTPPNGEASTSNNINTNTNMYEFLTHTSDAIANTSIDVTPSANEEIDLELHLGRNQ
ncbi:uncharacterized protein LOC109811489 [Cajanus cajan]|uniref:uncharacterized protein LOC109811488 n=1 Tax=Cajanus cajan TaxID=3821 RepID=UPI00098D8B97|nr:uncharacterized protein LOC109811488 [Cajanus cajan]XP_020230835.1 uncharacterized protein LOC109811489 [Cajanus cajan]